MGPFHPAPVDQAGIAHPHSTTQQGLEVRLEQRIWSQEHWLRALPQPWLSGPVSSHSALDILNGSIRAAGEGQSSVCDVDPIFCFFQDLVHQSFPFLKALQPFIFMLP